MLVCYPTPPWGLFSYMPRPAPSRRWRFIRSSAADRARPAGEDRGLGVGDLCEGDGESPTERNQTPSWLRYGLSPAERNRTPSWLRYGLSPAERNRTPSWLRYDISDDAAPCPRIAPLVWARREPVRALGRSTSAAAAAPRAGDAVAATWIVRGLGRVHVPSEYPRGTRGGAATRRIWSRPQVRDVEEAQQLLRGRKRVDARGRHVPRYGAGAAGAATDGADDATADTSPLPQHGCAHRRARRVSCRTRPRSPARA